MDDPESIPQSPAPAAERAGEVEALPEKTILLNREAFRKALRIGRVAIGRFSRGDSIRARYIMAEARAGETGREAKEPEVVIAPEAEERAEAEAEVAPEVGEEAVEEAVEVEPIAEETTEVSPKEPPTAEAETAPAPATKVVAPTRTTSPTDKFEGLRRSHFGGWGKDGKYNFVYDPARISEKIHIPVEDLLAAAEKGISPEYLVMGKSDEYAAEHLRKEFGIDWGPEASPTGSTAKFAEVNEADLDRASTLSGKKITESYINAAKAEYERGNLFPVEYLATLGIFLVPERLDPPDPVTLANAVGRDRLKEVTDLTIDISKNPGEVSKRLRRPGSLPLPDNFYENGLLRFLVTDRLNSVVAPIFKRILSWRIARKELGRRDKIGQEYQGLTSMTEDSRTEEGKKRIKALEHNYPNVVNRIEADRGLLGIGLPLYREIHNYIDGLDAKVGSHRKQLSSIERHKMHDLSTGASNLAYRVRDTVRALSILKKKQEITDYTDPTYIHNHEEFKDLRAAYVKAYIKGRP